MADGPMSTPRLPAPRSSGAPMIAAFMAMVYTASRPGALADAENRRPSGPVTGRPRSERVMVAPPMASGSHRPDVAALLRAQHAVARVLARSGPGDDVMAALLPAIGESLEWPAASFWEAVEGEAPACREVWCAESFDGDGWGHAVFVPLIGAEGRLGAMQFLSPGPPEADEQLAQALATLGRHIGRHLERQSAEAELRRADALMRAMLNAAFDAIVTMDAEGAIAGVNPAAEELFGRTQEEL